MSAATSSTGSEKLVPGKVPPKVLAQILDLPRLRSEDLLVAPGLGEDGALVQFRDRRVVVASDPITFSTSRPGHYAVCVNANDIAVMGAVPRFFTLTGLFPPGTTSDTVLQIMADTIETAEARDMILIGGHTEITDAVCRPVISLTMFGCLVSDRVIRTGGAQADDVIVQVNPLALEGTAILADERRGDLTDVLDDEALRFARGLLDDPGISVVAPALLLAEHEAVHALHDPTEGGLATGLREMAVASGLGVHVRETSLCRLDVTEIICQHLGYHSLGLISSGCLLAAVAASAAEDVVSALRREGYTAAAVGHFTTGRDCRLTTGEGDDIALPEFDVDELARQ